MFYFSKPKNMTNTYVMKRYDRTKLLNIDPRNIIQISKGVRSVIISGTSYPLELEQDAKPLDLNHTDKDIENRIGKCIDHYQFLLDEYKRLEAEEADYINGSLFIDNRQKRALRKAFKEMRTEITDYNNEIKEIQQTYYGQG
jgi:MoxR-like ATPase